jgi:hypothetical protein
VASRGSQPGFEVQESVRACRHTLVLSGELDLAVAAGLEATVLGLCRTPGRGQVLRLLELTGTTDVLPLADAPSSPPAGADHPSAHQ